MIPSVAIIMTAALGFSCGNEQNGVAGLHVAAVPILALVHHSEGPVATFPELFPLQVAVYWTNPDEGVLGVVHALREMGVPFFVTRDLGQALKHRLVIIYPSADAKTFSAGQIEELKQHVQRGGGIFGVNVLAPSLGEVFGFSAVTPSRERHRVIFAAGADPTLRYLNRPEELQIPLGASKYMQIVWTNGYVAEGGASVLARFEDGTAAVLRKSSGKGSAYLCGLSFHDVIVRNQVNRDFDAGRHYVNAFEPGGDVWLLVLRAWYETWEPAAVRLATMPNGQMSVVLLTHDVDWENSFAPALAFAKVEASLHTSSTLFVQTKYVSDTNSHAFFFGKNLTDLLTLYSEGISIGSHSIIHSRGFNKFELGSGAEEYPAYQPLGTGFDTAQGASVFGEVHVSKELLDGLITGQHTDFFRAGHLRVPPTLPEALQRSGYRYDSSFTADDVLSNFPYALPLGLLFEEDSGIYEFPVTIDDSEDPPLGQRVASAIELIRANEENGAPSVVLIHTTESEGKLAAEETLLRQLPPDVTAMSLESFARFWRARDRMQWSARAANDRDATELDVTADEEVDGLTFEFQREISELKGAELLSDHRRIVLPALHTGEHARVQIYFHRSQ